MFALLWDNSPKLVCSPLAACRHMRIVPLTAARYDSSCRHVIPIHAFRHIFAHMPDERRLATATLAANEGTFDVLRRTAYNANTCNAHYSVRACVRALLHSLRPGQKPTERELVDSLKILTKLSVNTELNHHFIFSDLSKIFLWKLKHFLSHFYYCYRKHYIFLWWFE